MRVDDRDIDELLRRGLLREPESRPVRAKPTPESEMPECRGFGKSACGARSDVMIKGLDDHWRCRRCNLAHERLEERNDRDESARFVPAQATAAESARMEALARASQSIRSGEHKHRPLLLDPMRLSSRARADVAREVASALPVRRSETAGDRARRIREAYMAVVRDRR